jgi:hypothetical protein
MRFFPHGFSSSVVLYADYATRAVTASYLNNTGSVLYAVGEASLALNISGARGAAGSNFATAPGPTGATGATGEAGKRGDSIFLLSASWHAGAACSSPPVSCTAVITFTANKNPETGAWRCNFGIPAATYYSTDPLAPQNGISPMYTDQLCTQKIRSGSTLGAGPLNRIFTVDVNSTASVRATCGSSE